MKGRVLFDSPLQKASFLSSKLFGSIYKTTVPSAQRWWEFAVPRFLHSDPDGRDGSSSGLTKNTTKQPHRAQNKPHAVIANGKALLLVPSSLRMLQKVCREANVPLFVIRDPRAWGGNTHDSFSSMLQELRKTVKNRIVEQVVSLDGWSAFQKGRMLGQTETEAKWLLKDRVRRAKSFLTVGLGGGSSNRQQERKSAEELEDWSMLDESQLEEKLARYNLIQKEEGGSDGKHGSLTKVCSSSFLNLLKKCDSARDQRE